MTTLAHTGKRTAIVSLTAVALTIALAAGFAHLAPSVANELTQVSELGGKAIGDIGAVTASRKVQCIMPPAWRRGCAE